MYTYFTREQVVRFANSILHAHGVNTRFEDRDLNEWELCSPEIFQPDLPPIFELRQGVDFVIDDNWIPATVTRIHIHKGGNSYDLNLHLRDGSAQRIYNVSSSMIARDHWRKENITDSPKVKEGVFNMVNELRKIWGHAPIVDDGRPLTEQLRDVWQNKPKGK